MHSRRHFLKLALSGIATGLIPQSLLAAKGMNRSNLITSEVMKLSGGRPLSLTILYPEGALDNIKPVAERFTKETKVAILFKRTPIDNINTKLLIATSKGRGDFDIALPATFGISDLVEAEALADMTEMAGKYEPKIEYEPSLYEIGSSYKGRKYGYQSDGDVYLMFYNKLMYKNEGEKKRFEDKFNRELKLPASWKELDQQLEFFHNPENERYGGCLFRTPQYMVWEWWIRFHAKGYCPVKDDMTPNINNDAAIMALEEMIKVTDYLHPTVKINGLFENWKEFSKAKCAINIGWGGTQKFLNSNQSKIKRDMIYAPTPEVSYFNWGWSYVVSKFSTQRKLAYLFCLYATTPELSTIAVRQSNGFFDPFRKEHYLDQGIVETYSAEFLQAHKDAMSQAIPDFYIQGQGKYIEALRNNISSALQGDLTAREALEYTSKQWEKITDQFGRKRQIEQWKFLKAKYPKYLKKSLRL